MYRVIRASILYYEENMREEGSRYDLVLPFMLLIKLEVFDKYKHENAPAYQNLYDIAIEMQRLYQTGEHIYHHFNMLLNELNVLGFRFNEIKKSHNTPKDKLNAQIDLLLQFLSYRYPFDLYDNKIGCHDHLTNKYIFIQP